jgi:ubiquinone biosynthesis protein
MHFERYLPRGMRRLGKVRDPAIHQLSNGDRLRLAFTELGPTFVKLGQFMSNRPDVLPPDIVAALKGLQDSVAPFPAEESAHILEKEFGRQASELFAKFASEPFASASIAQVHRATLADGTEVAVKIQRPKLDQIVETDIDILLQVASIIDKHVEFAKYMNPVHICEEFVRSLRKELDFLNEASHMERFAENFEGDERIRVPAVFRKLTSRRVLTTEYVKGFKAGDVEGIRAAGLDPAVVAERGTALLLKQIFDHGFFHADPHAGNILVMPDGRICFLDFGIMGILSPTLKEYLVSIMVAVVNRDPRRIVRTLAEENGQPIANTALLEYDVTELMEDYVHLSLRDMNMGELLGRLTRIIITHRIRIMPGFYLLLKALVTIEGVGYTLDPQFALVKHVEPYAKKLMAERLNPFSHLRGALASGMDLGAILADMPYDLREIMRIVKAGQTRIEFEHRGLEPMLRTHEQLVDRLVFALILASLIIGSSLVVLSRIPPKFHDIPVIGLAGFVAAAVLGFGLLAAIMVGKRR